MYVITGASGHTGKQIANALLEAGKPVTVVGRSADHLKELTDRGARAAIGQLEDVDFLTETFQGATAVYALIPPSFTSPDFLHYQQTIADSLVTAIQVNRAPNVVTLSSFGAHLSNVGVVKGMGYLEQQLNALPDVNALHLRAGFFFDNLFNYLGVLKQAGILAGFPIDGDKPVPMVHTSDIARVAVRHLLALDFTGKQVAFVAGPKDVTFQEVARVIGRNIGREDLPYVSAPYEEARKNMVQAGLLPDLADNYIEMCARINDGSFTEGFVRDASNTTPTTLDEFAGNEFVPAYQNA